MSELRAFPDRPSLEFDRKAAKALLRQLRAGDSVALERARARGVHPPQLSAPFTLADAQLVVAREYGFASWSRLVRYHGDIVRQARALEFQHTPEQWEGIAKSLLARHNARHSMAARTLAAFVPRFYGLTPEEVLSMPVAPADARIAIARQEGQPSWNALLNADAPSRRRSNHWEITPLEQAGKAIDENNVENLKSVLRAHPEILNPPPYDREHGATLANMAIGSRKSGRSLSRLSHEMREYLVASGVDLQSELHSRLCNPFTARTLEDAQWWLDCGADPDWIGPRGFSMLEMAMVVLWNGAVVDLLAAHSKPRKALWISAALGDVQGISSFLDRHGHPTEAARDLRSPFDCSRIVRITPLFNPDANELLMEPLALAAFNGRANVIDFLAARGVNLDNMAWGVPILNIAVGNGWLEAVEALIRNGARADIRSENDSNGDARAMARWMWNNSNDDPGYRRIAELCGLNIEKLRAERDAKLPADPPYQQKLADAIAFAQQAAHEQHKQSVTARELLLGILRPGGSPLLYYAGLSKLDRELFNAHIMPIAMRIGEPEAGLSIPFDAEVQRCLDDAKAMAKEYRKKVTSVLAVLHAMTKNEAGYTVELVRKYGGSIDALNRELERAMRNEPT